MKGWNHYINFWGGILCLVPIITMGIFSSIIQEGVSWYLIFGLIGSGNFLCFMLYHLMEKQNNTHRIKKEENK